MQHSAPHIGRLFIPLALAVMVMTLAGLRVILFKPAQVLADAPAQGLTNVIRNGDFEQNPTSSLATHWQPYDNGQAHFGWYDERWAEAVHSGQHSQLMEIFQVEASRSTR